MRRRKYETAEHRKVQRDCADHLEACMPVCIEEIPSDNNKGSRIDWFVWGEGGLVAIAEHKHRNWDVKNGGGIYLSLTKAQYGVELSDKLKVPFWFVVDNGAVVWFAEVHDLSAYTLLPVGGRTTQTRDAYDVEAVIIVPTNDFMEIQKGAKV